jgi:hypothetical protein
VPYQSQALPWSVLEFFAVLSVNTSEDTWLIHLKWPERSVAECLSWGRTPAMKLRWVQCVYHTPHHSSPYPSPTPKNQKRLSEWERTRQIFIPDVRLILLLNRNQIFFNIWKSPEVVKNIWHLIKVFVTKSDANLSTT